MDLENQIDKEVDKIKKKSDDKFSCEELKKKFNEFKEYWSDNYDNAENDLHFISGEEGAQWLPDVYAERVSAGRPVITVDKLDQFLSQVKNQIKSNTPTISVYPSDEQGTEEDAEILKGFIRSIEYASNADSCYDTGLSSAVECGIGFIAVDHRYVDSLNGGKQELFIKRVVNPLGVFLDPMSVNIDGSDAKEAFIFEDITKKDFKRRFPNATPTSWEDVEKEVALEDVIRIVEHYCLCDEDEESVIINELGESIKVTKKRTVVKRTLFTSGEVLETALFPGRYIPIVPVYGREVWEKTKRILLSLIRKAKDSQMLANYWKSLETELLQRQTLAPVMAAEGQIEDYAEDWTDPAKAIALRYKAKDAQGDPMPPPQRLMPPQSSNGFMNASVSSVEDIKQALGMYAASLGERSNETSGKAISERKAQGDMATWHFGDNLFKSIAQVGRVLLFAIPDVYTEKRVITVVGKDDTPSQVGINGYVAQGQEKTFSLNTAAYSVRVTTGAPFATLRNEASQTMMDLIQANPQLMGIFGDLMIKNMDFPGADAISERLKKTMAPQIIGGEEGENPELAQAQAQIQQLTQQMQMMAQQLESKQGEEQLKMQVEQSKLALEQEKIANERAKIELEKQKIQAEMQIKSMEIDQKDRELELRTQEGNTETEIKVLELMAKIEDLLLKKNIDKENQSAMIE